MASWLLLQLADSAFPAGGFAHSGGLEAMMQQGELEAPDALRGFLEQALWQTGRGALPLVSAAHADPGAHAALDARADALLVSHVANRASRQQGRALLATAVRSFELPALAALQREARAAGLATHHAPVFGAIAARLDLPADETRQAFLHLQLRGLTSAAVRLGLLGPHEAQGLHFALGPLLTRVHDTCAPLGLDALAQTAPLLDLFGATHDRLYSRLFLS
ncbi:MAG: urease accessory protein UreF [Myxococcales bacterium]|nr:MAG: urease accessory protein UreF [Myxococcales bacterium]